MTINQIVTQIKASANQHKQIKSVVMGSLLEALSNSDIQYPLFCFDITGSTINGTVYVLSIDMFFLDRILADNSNEVEVLSDQNSIACDILSMLRNNEKEFTLEDNISISFLRDATPDIIGGVQMGINLSYPFIYNECEVPL